MNIHILLVEDNEPNRELLTYLLEHHGYKVKTALDGPAGLASALEGGFDLVLMDIQLPGMSGYEVVKKIRDNPGTYMLPVIAVTSHALVGDREYALAAGFNGYVEKPIDIHAFMQEVRRLLPAGMD